MKKFLFVAVLMLQAMSMSGQKMSFIFSTSFNHKDALLGGMEGKNYAAIIDTKLSKKEVVEKTTDFMAEYGMVNKEDVKLDNIDESTSEFTVPMVFPQTQYKSGMAYFHPLMVDGDIRFEFHDNGKVMVVAQNLDARLFGIYDEAMKKRDESETMQKYFEEMHMLMMTKTWLGKALIWANTSPDERKAVYDYATKYFEDMSSKVKVYAAMIKNNEAGLFNAPDAIKQLEAYPIPGSKYIIKYLQGCIDEKRMPGVNQKRWEKQVRQSLDNLFMATCYCLDGNIEGVAEDGNQTWELVDGILLPTDPKLQKTYLKKGRDYFSQED